MPNPIATLLSAEDLAALPNLAPLTEDKILLICDGEYMKVYHYSHKLKNALLLRVQFDQPLLDKLAQLKAKQPSEKELEDMGFGVLPKDGKMH